MMDDTPDELLLFEAKLPTLADEDARELLGRRRTSHAVLDGKLNDAEESERWRERSAVDADSDDSKSGGSSVIAEENASSVSGPSTAESLDRVSEKWGTG